MRECERERDRYLDTAIRGISDGGQEIVIHGVEGHGESAIDDPTVNVHPKIDLHDVGMLQDNVLLARVGGVMGHLVIQAEAGGEAHARLEAVARPEASIAQHGPHAVLDALGDGQEGLAGLDRVVDPLAGLAVNLGGSAVVVEEALVLDLLAAGVSQFSVRGASQISIESNGRLRAVLLKFPDGVLAGGEEVAQRDARRRRLGLGFVLLFLRLSLLLALALVDAIRGSLGER